MLSTQMIKLAERNQWKTNTEEQTIFGEYNGYLFTGIDGSGFKAFITPIAGISPAALKNLLGFLEKNTKVLHLYNFEVEDNFLCIRMAEGLLPLKTDKMEYLLGQISGLLSLGDLPTGACVVCGGDAPRKGLYYGLFCHLHPECQDRELTDFTRIPDEEAEVDETPADEFETEPADDNAGEEPAEAAAAETGADGSEAES